MRKATIICASAALILTAFAAFGQPLVVEPLPVEVVPVEVVEPPATVMDTVIQAALAALLSVATVVVGYGVAIARKFLKGVGVNLTDLQAQKIQGFVERAIKWGAERLGLPLNGKLTPIQKEQIVALAATEYMPANARETVRDLGGDVTNKKAMIQLVTARGADILNAPSVGVTETARTDAALKATGLPPINTPVATGPARV